MDHKLGWIYCHSELLQQDFAVKELPRGKVDVYTQDKTHYTQAEFDVIKNNHDGKYSNKVHVIKSVFKGTIVK